MTSSEIRSSFLEFFKERGHTIVPSAPVIPFNDPTLLFTNAGMNQFKDVFLETGKRIYRRAVDTQKCIRVSGKHNDLEEVGRDTYHHTFFEMLGNWSFGDYYKKEAIAWAWELLTTVWRLPKNRLWATVYKDDAEAEEYWKTATDIDPKHILRFGEKDNFWEMGETGPCGPCSEIHFDRTPGGNAAAEMVNAGTSAIIEIWNLVFIQYDRDENGKLTPLPARHVDTGMGFERICAVLQGKDSNYDTDIFAPLINRISELTKKPYHGNLQSPIDNRQSEINVAVRVIADHVRTLTFAVGDGAIPSNEGRGYVLRRILRRAARFGRNLGMHEPFIYRLVPTLVETMGDVFPEIKSKQEHIQKVIQGEEEGFNATLDRGLEIFDEYCIKSVDNYLKENRFEYELIHDYERSQYLLTVFDIRDKIEGGYLELVSSDWNNDSVKQISEQPISFPGEYAFQLYDTYGFPLDLTELMASERWLKVDVSTFTELMEEQKKRSRESRISIAETLSISDSIEIIITRQREYAKQLDTSSFEKSFKFVGYKNFEAESSILLSKDNLIILESTPFYGESGGQVGDTGDIKINDSILQVLDTQKSGNVNVHILNKTAPTSSGIAYARVDKPRRLSITRNHSATHLLHNALRRILGMHVQQAGSLVAPDYFRFDFTHYSKLTEKELSDIEALVNEKIKENIARTPNLNNIPFDEAKKMGALMFFGEKYGDRVNVVQFGNFSTEFCGGTHVNATGEIGYFKIRSEGSIASGVRRIEAVTHEYALEYLRRQDRAISDQIDSAYRQLEELSNLEAGLRSSSGDRSDSAGLSISALKGQLEGLKAATGFPKTVSAELAITSSQIDARQRATDDLLAKITDAKKTFEKEIGRHHLQSLAGSLDDLIRSAQNLNGVKVVASRTTAGSIDELKSLGDALRAKLGSGIGVLGSIIDNKVQLVCVVTDDLVRSKKADAGKIVGAVAKILGGGGGGRPHLATAGAKDTSRLDDALAETVSIVQSLTAEKP
jgi:alanyl-tRNA synthetase